LTGLSKQYMTSTSRGSWDVNIPWEKSSRFRGAKLHWI